MKLLSIIIPTYNMEKLLPRCLESVTDKTLNKTLEVIIVNDGSTDKSLEIAQKFQSHYPEIINIVNKPNGNYGSCINAALPIAQGKYIKILDADDWYNTSSLKEFLNKLSHTNSDVIITNYTEVYGEKKYNIQYNFPTNQELSASSVMLLSEFIKLRMHAVTYKKDLFKEFNYSQTCGISHTDEEWMFYPMRFVKTITFYRLNLYQYMLDREGQTMDPKLSTKRYQCFAIILERMISEYSQWNNTLTSYSNTYLSNRILVLARSAYKIALLNNTSNISLKELDKLDLSISKNINLYMELEKMPIHQMIPYKFIKLYHTKHKKPNFMIKLLYHIAVKIHYIVKSSL